MRHLPFMKALAEVKDTSDPVWRDASAGYLVLRFFDRWLDDGPALASFDQTLPALKARLASSEDVNPQVQELLLTAVQTMIDAPGTNPSSVVGPLQAYGKYLETAGRLELAAHVYQTIMDALDPPSGCSDPLSAAMVFKQYGMVSRLLGDFDASSDAYQRAITLAEQANAMELAFSTRVGMANTLSARGNLPEAEALLSQIVANALTAKMVNAESWARHSRGVVRTLRERFVDAMMDFFRAYELTEDSYERERILGDLAACAGCAGYRTMARDAYRVLAYTARRPAVRSAALGNLLEIAVDDNDVGDFERIQGHISIHAQKHSLSAEHALYIALYTAYGAERFRSRDVAIAAYQSVIAQAHSLKAHQVEFKAEARLAALVAGDVLPVTPPCHEPPESLHSLVHVIAEWSELASRAV